MNLDPTTFDKLNVAWASTTTDEAYLALCAHMGLEQIAREGLESSRTTRAALAHAACASTPCAVCAAHNTSESRDAAARMTALLLAEGLPISTEPHDADCPCDACNEEYGTGDARAAYIAAQKRTCDVCGCPGARDTGFGATLCVVCIHSAEWAATLEGGEQSPPTTPARCVCGRPYADCPNSADHCAQEAAKIAACRDAERIAQLPSYAGMTCLSPYSQAEQEKWAADNARCNALRQENWEGECADVAAANAARATAHAAAIADPPTPTDDSADQAAYAAAEWARLTAPIPPTPTTLPQDAPTPAQAYADAKAVADSAWSHWRVALTDWHEGRGTAEVSEAAFASWQAAIDHADRLQTVLWRAAHATPTEAYADACTRRDAAYAAWEQAHLAGDWNSDKLYAIYADAHAALNALPGVEVAYWDPRRAAAGFPTSTSGAR